MTDDEKSDWWYSVESQGKKKLGPRPELVAEIMETNKVDRFYMYNSEQFLKHAKVHLQAQVSDESLDQVRRVADQTTNRERRLVSDGAKAERAAIQWILDSNPGDEIIKKTSTWPDLILRNLNTDDLTAYEVVCIRGRHLVLLNLKERFNRASYELMLKRFSSFTFVLVLSDILQLMSFQKLTETGRLEIPDGINIIIGVINKNSEGREIFIHLNGSYQSLN